MPFPQKLIFSDCSSDDPCILHSLSNIYNILSFITCKHIIYCNDKKTMEFNAFQPHKLFGASFPIYTMLIKFHRIHFQ